jgi:hypothetical protein
MLQLEVDVKNALEARSQQERGARQSFDSNTDASESLNSIEPTEVAKAIQCGLQAIIQSTSHFMAEPPRIADGIGELGTELLQCISQLLTEEQKRDPNFSRFDSAWTSTFEGIPDASKEIEEDIKLYSATGDPPPLIRAIGNIIATAGSAVTGFLPMETSTEVEKYLGTVVETLEIMSLSWDDFAEGRTAEGIEDIYNGLKEIFEGFAPQDWKDNAIYDTLIGSLDTILGQLSKHVLEYERRILESKVCWRAEKNRERLIADVCPDGYISGGDSYCYPMVLLGRESASVKNGHLDGSVQEKDAGNYQNGPPSRSAIPARCDSDSSFSEKHGHFCYTTCGGGFQPKSQFKCISACEGNFSAETPAMCGRDPGIVAKAILEMVTTTLNSGFVLADNIIRMTQNGVNGEVLSATIQVFIDMGKPFANPICPVPAGAGNPVVYPDSRRRGAKAPPKPRPTCSFGEQVFISSHRGRQLHDGNGDDTWHHHVKFSSNKLGWEKWTLSDAGDGKVFITSFRGKQLCDKYGNIKLTSNKLKWEKWTLGDAGGGKVFITTHRYQHLQDFHGEAKLSFNPDNWEKFTIVDMDGNNVCNVPVPTEAPTALACSPDGSDRWSPNLQGCCSGMKECTEPRPSTSAHYCDVGDANHGFACWSTRVMCRSSCSAMAPIDKTAEPPSNGVTN